MVVDPGVSGRPLVREKRGSRREAQKEINRKGRRPRYRPKGTIVCKRKERKRPIYVAELIAVQK